MSRFSFNVPSTKLCLIKMRFYWKRLDSAVLRGIFNLLMKQNSDAGVLFTSSPQACFCRCRAVLSTSAPLSSCLLDLLAASVHLQLPSYLFCLAALIGDGGGFCPQRRAGRQAGVPWRRSTPPPVARSSWVHSSQASGVSGDQPILAVESGTLALFTLHLNMTLTRRTETIEWKMAQSQHRQTYVEANRNTNPVFPACVQLVTSSGSCQHVACFLNSNIWRNTQVLCNNPAQNLLHCMQVCFILLPFVWQLESSVSVTFDPLLTRMLWLLFRS